MSHTPNQLDEDFPGMAERMHALKTSNNRFARLIEQAVRTRPATYRAIVAAAGPAFQGAAVSQGQAQAPGGLADGLGQGLEGAGAGLGLDNVPDGLGGALADGFRKGTAVPAGNETSAGERRLAGA